MSAAPSLLDKTLRQFKRAWRLTSVAHKDDDIKSQVAPGLPESDLPVVRSQVDACLESRGGEVSARARAARLGEMYLDLNDEGRERFLRLLAVDYDVPMDSVEALVEQWREASDKTARWEAQAKLRRALEPPRMRLLRQFNELDSGVKFLVDLRAYLRKVAGKNKAMKALDSDLRDLLTSWFDIGFLDLQRITWDTPAALLEKLIEYEAVHAIKSWDDLKNRLMEDRRCFAFFHPRMPDEPLIFVQVALVKGMSGDVHTLLDESAPLEDPAAADTAIFYSISNCQSGLAGVSFGNFLIKRVAKELARDLPNLKAFATLSPIPGFSQWLRETLDNAPEQFDSGAVPPVILEKTGFGEWPGALRKLLEDHDSWTSDDAVQEAIRPLLARACADYLLNAKRGGRARDPVAHFHLSNGARVERLNWMGDRSAEGMKRSAGMMVNYLYALDDVDANHEAYTGDGEVKAANAVARLLK